MSRIKLASATAAVAALGLTGCGGAPAAGGDTILIGGPLATTGAAGSVGLDIKQAAELAIAEINAAGGIDGKKLKLIAEDTAGEPAQAVQVTTSLARDKNVVALLGPLLTPEVGAATDLALANKIAMVPPASAGEVPGVENSKFNEYTFRLNQAFSSTAAPAMTKVIELTKAKHVTVISQDDNPTYVDTAKEWTKAAEAAGVKTDNIAFPTTQTDFSSIITSIEKDTDLIAIAALPPTVASVVRSARQRGLDAELMGETALISQEAFDGSRGGTEGAYAVSTFVPDASPESAAFAKAFKAKYDREPTTFSALSYEAIKMIAQAAEKGGATREGIQKALSELDGYEGITGTFRYEGSGDALRESVPLVQVDSKGGLKTVAQVTPVTE